MDYVSPAHSSLEFFKEQVEAACLRQNVRPDPLTSYYLVTLLDEFTQIGKGTAAELAASNKALGIRLAEALQSAGNERRTGLRHVGDASLFLAGFFSDSLRRSLVDVDYYVSLGGYAYGSIAILKDPLSSVFAELSEKFVAFVDVLDEISERTCLTDDKSLLRLYEKWVRTGSKRSGKLLAEQGIVPNRTISAKFVH